MPSDTNTSVSKGFSGEVVDQYTREGNIWFRYAESTRLIVKHEIIHLSNE